MTSESGGYSSRMAAAPMARELMWPGVPVTAWATMRARRSNTALARSPASRTMGLKAARCKALACSLTVAIRLCHSTSSSMDRSRRHLLGGHRGIRPPRPRPTSPAGSPRWSPAPPRWRDREAGARHRALTPVHRHVERGLYGANRPADPVGFGRTPGAAARRARSGGLGGDEAARSRLRPTLGDGHAVDAGVLLVNRRGRPVVAGHPGPRPPRR